MQLLRSLWKMRMKPKMYHSKRKVATSLVIASQRTVSFHFALCRDSAHMIVSQENYLKSYR